MHWRYCVILMLVAAATLGCGPAKVKKYPVSGTVKMPDGSPLADGKIVFMSTDGVAPDAGTIKNGQFSFNSLPGKKKVEITADREEGPVDPAMGAAPRAQYIAAEFNTETKLEADVTTAGPNKFEYTVSEKKK